MGFDFFLSQEERAQRVHPLFEGMAPDERTDRHKRLAYLESQRDYHDRKDVEGDWTLNVDGFARAYENATMLAIYRICLEHQGAVAALERYLTQWLVGYVHLDIDPAGPGWAAVKARFAANLVISRVAPALFDGRLDWQLAERRARRIIVQVALQRQLNLIEAGRRQIRELHAEAQRCAGQDLARSRTAIGACRLRQVEVIRLKKLLNLPLGSGPEDWRIG